MEIYHAIWYDASMKSLYHPNRAEITLSVVLSALSDPIRLDIVRELSAGNAEQSCATFGVAVAKSTLSHHFRVLREAGITQTRIEGTQRLVSLRYADLEERFPGLLRAVLGASGPL